MWTWEHITTNAKTASDADLQYSRRRLVAREHFDFAPYASDTWFIPSDIGLRCFGSQIVLIEPTVAELEYT